MTIASSRTGRADATLTRRAVLFVAAIAGIWAMKYFQGFLVPTVIGGFLALILTPVVAKLERTGMPRALAAGGVVLAALLTLGGIVWTALPGYDDYASRVPEIVRDVERKIAPLQEKAADAGLIPESDGADETASGADEDRSRGDGPDDARSGSMDLPMPDRSFYADALLEAPALLGNFLYIVFLTFFVILDRRRLSRTMLSTQSSYESRAWLLRVLRRIRGDVARYLLTVTVINVCLGIAVGLSYWALGMPNPVLWGTGMALLNFIPYLGAAMMNVATLAVAFIHYPTFLMALAPVAVLLTLNLIEGQMVTPMVVGSNVAEGALAVFLAVTFGAWLWGPAGAVLATPTLIVAQTVLRSRREERRVPAG